MRTSRTILFLLIVMAYQSVDAWDPCAPIAISGEMADRAYRMQHGEQPLWLIEPRCCDLYVQLRTSDGKYICAPSGGITGNGAGDCPDWVDAIEGPQGAVDCENSERPIVGK